MRTRTWSVAGAALPVAVAFLGVSLAGCTHAVEETADRKVNDVLPRYLGPADHYETHLHASSTGAMLRGRVQSIEIVGTGVHLQPELTVEMLEIEAQAVEVDPKHGSLENVGSASFACTITSSQLDRYMRSRRTNIAGLSVKVGGDRLIVRAKPEALGLIGIPVQVRGTLAPEPGGTFIDFVPDRASVAIVPIPGPVLDLLAQRLNPVIDLTRLPIGIHIDSALCDGDVLTLRGTVDTSDILKAAAQSRH